VELFTSQIAINFENFDAYFVYTCFSMVDIAEEIRSLQLDSAGCVSILLFKGSISFTFYLFI